MQTSHVKLQECSGGPSGFSYSLCLFPCRIVERALKSNKCLRWACSQGFSCGAIDFYYLPLHLETKVMQAINHLSLGCKIFPSSCFCTEGVVLCESQLYARVSTPTSYLFWLQGPNLQCARSSLESKFQVRRGFQMHPAKYKLYL